MAYASLSWLIVERCKELLSDRARLTDDEFLTQAEALSLRMFEYGSDLSAVSASLYKHRKKGEKLPPPVIDVLVEATRREHPHFSALIDQLGIFYLRAPESPDRDKALNRDYRAIPQGSVWPRLFDESGKPRYNVCSFYFVHGWIMDGEMKRVMACSERMGAVMRHYPDLQENEREIIDHYRKGKTRYTYAK